MARTVFCVLAISLLGLAPTACTDSSNTDAGSDQASNIVRRGNGGDSATLNPLLAEDVHALNVIVDLYEGLVAENARGEIVPGVAESWTVSDDGLVYTFSLRDNARWSNGDPVLASHFVAAFRAAATADEVSGYSVLLEPIVNFTAVRNGNTVASTLGASSKDEKTLRIALSQPTPHFLSILALPITFPKHPVETQDRDNFIGNGPFVLTERNVDGPIRLSRNSNYWDAHSVRLDEVIYFPISDVAAEFNMYRSGELDITNSIPPGQIQRAREQVPGEVRVSPSLALYYLAFDLTEPPFDDRALRRALSLAINRDELVDAIGRGERAAYSVVPPGVSGHRSFEYAWRNDSAEIRKQKARQAYSQSTAPRTIKLTYDVGDIHETIALIVAGMWRDVLGIDVQLEKKEWKFFLDTRDDRAAWEIMRFAWFGDYNDPSTFLNIFVSQSPQNLPRYSSDEYDDALRLAAVERNLDDRMKLTKSAEELLLKDYPIAPLYFYVSKHLVKPHVQGFEDSVLDRHPSKYLSIKRN